MTALALVGLAFGVGYAVANIHRRTPPMSLLELLFGGVFGIADNADTAWDAISQSESE